MHGLAPAAASLALLALAPPALARGELTSAAACWQRSFDRERCRVGPHAHVARRVEPLPAQLRARYGVAARAFAIDVDRDGDPEYVVDRFDDEGRLVATCFLGSRLQERRCAAGEHDGFAHWWFVELEPGRPLYLLEMSGDEDLTDLAVFRIAPRTWGLTKVLELQPIAADRGPRGPRAYLGHARTLRDLALVRRGGQILLRVLPPGACNIPEPPSTSPTVNEHVGVVFDGLPVGVRGDGCARAVAHARLLTLAETIRLAGAPVTKDANGVPIPVAPGYEPAPTAAGEPLEEPAEGE